MMYFDIGQMYMSRNLNLCALMIDLYLMICYIS